MSKTFDKPVILDLPDGSAVVSDVADAHAVLASVEWPVRGPRHRDAVDTCLKVVDGHRVAAEARAALIAAADEAGIPASG
jgi:hypothetical protein